MKQKISWLLIGTAMLFSGCALKEIRSSTKTGPAFKHSGKNRTNSTRWYAIQGYDFKMSNSSSVGVTFRRRDTAEGSGNNDSGVLFDYACPIWKKTDKNTKKSRKNSERLQRIDERLTKLEQQSQTDFQEP